MVSPYASLAQDQRVSAVSEWVNVVIASFHHKAILRLYCTKQYTVNDDNSNDNVKTIDVIFLNFILFPFYENHE